MVGGKIVVTPEDRFIPIMPRPGAVEVIELGERDFLYLNDGKGRFAPVSWTNGSFLDEDGKPLAAPPKDWGLSVMFRDMNDDGAPDIYVCNDFFNSPDRVWINEQGRRFRAVARPALRNMSLASMAVDFADINRDGHDDFFVADMLSRKNAFRQRQRPNVMKGLIDPPMGDPNFRPEVARNTLFLNHGDGTYAEIAQLSGLEATEWTWGAVFLDVDLDGYEDLLIANGNNHDVQDADVQKELARKRGPGAPDEGLKNLQKFPRLELPNLAFRNRRDLTFEEVGYRWGFSAVGISHGMALADLDNDGDLDVVINNLNSGAGVYRNDSSAPRVAVRLKGQPPNTRGVCAKIKFSGGPVTQTQEMIAGGRYLSSDDYLRVFAAGSNKAPLGIEVVWRSGRQSRVVEVQPNFIYEIEESGAGSPQSAPRAPTPQPWFEDVSGLISHTHVDESFDDFARQPLLPIRLSQLGPGVAWHDLDNDGWDDLIIGTGKGGRVSAFHNNRGTGFSDISAAPITENVVRDQTAILGMKSTDGHTLLLAGSANYEDGLGAAPVRIYDLELKTVSELLPRLETSTGPLALGDVDGDGDLDLFVGGRALPGRHPDAASSGLYRNEQAQFKRDESLSLILSNIGSVSGAAFSDLDGDGDPDLILACEWGPVRVFINERGAFIQRTEELGFTRYTGWWNGVATGDFDGDGRVDIVVSNWGRNTKYQSHLGRPFRVYYGDFEGSGATDLIEAYFEKSSGKYVPWRDWETVGRAMPFVAKNFPSFGAYGDAGVEEILGEKLRAAKVLEVATLDSMLFLNRGNRFEARSLPIEAQFAPALGVVVGDYDGDGDEDIFLSQNFFAVAEETSRYDGGLGLWLHGNGAGSFKAISANESGIRVLGEQRGTALADFDRDGRVDLVVTQNRQTTRLYRNTRAKAGLRVQLNAGPLNPTGVGAALRLLYGEKSGPLREVQVGSGYWSQNSVVQVLGKGGEPTGIWVRWPGGKEMKAEIPADAREIRANITGEVKSE